MNLLISIIVFREAHGVEWGRDAGGRGWGKDGHAFSFLGIWGIGQCCNYGSVNGCIHSSIPLFIHLHYIGSYIHSSMVHFILAIHSLSSFIHASVHSLAMVPNIWQT